MAYYSEIKGSHWPQGVYKSAVHRQRIGSDKKETQALMPVLACKEEFLSYPESKMLAQKDETLKLIYFYVSSV